RGDLDRRGGNIGGLLDGGRVGEGQTPYVDIVLAAQFEQRGIAACRDCIAAVEAGRRLESQGLRCWIEPPLAGLVQQRLASGNEIPAARANRIARRLIERDDALIGIDRGDRQDIPRITQLRKHRYAFANGWLPGGEVGLV